MWARKREGSWGGTLPTLISRAMPGAGGATALLWLAWASRTSKQACTVVGPLLGSSSSSSSCKAGSCRTWAVQADEWVLPKRQE